MRRAQFSKTGAPLVCALALTSALGVATGAADAPPPFGAPTDKVILENPISQPPPIYPQAAYEADVEGFVTVEVVLRPDGTVLNATVLKAEPPGWGFEEAALGAVRKWRYMSSGREVRFETIVEFKIPPEFRVPPVPIDRKSD